jgi:hypothetical protein
MPDRKFSTKALPLVLVSASLSGCGLRTPVMELSNETYPTLRLVNNIVDHVKDELGCAIVGLIDDDRDRMKGGKPSAYPWLSKATGKVSLKLTVDEKSALGAGLTYSDFFTNAVSTIGKTVITTPRSFALGANISGSSEAQRVDNSDYTLNIEAVFVKDPKYQRGGDACTYLTHFDGVFTDSNLQIKDWLQSRLELYAIDPDVKSSSVPDTLTTEITFTVAYGGNATPSWHLVPTSYNTAANPFLGLSRSRINDIIITIAQTPELAAQAQNIQKLNSGYSNTVTAANAAQSN